MGKGGVKNSETLSTSFMDGPQENIIKTNGPSETEVTPKRVFSAFRKPHKLLVNYKQTSKSTLLYILTIQSLNFLCIKVVNARQIEV